MSHASGTVQRTQHHHEFLRQGPLFEKIREYKKPEGMSTVVVSIGANDPKGWGTSAKAFWDALDLDEQAIVRAEWGKMHAEVTLYSDRAYTDPQDYYTRAATPMPLVRMCKLPHGRLLYALLVHAPDFAKVDHKRGMALLRGIYRIVKTVQTIKGGVHLTPLSSGAFAAGYKDEALAVCALELRDSGATVWAFDAIERAALAQHWWRQRGPQHGGASRKVKPHKSYKPAGRRMHAFGKERVVWVEEGNKTDLFVKVKHRTENRFVFKKIL